MNTPGPVNTISNNYQRGMSDVAPTLQRTFDFVATHLLRQMKKAQRISKKSGKVICAYRSPEGLSCAVGCLIPDDVYIEAMDESGSVSAIIDKFADVLPLYFEDQHYFLAGLQSIHDLHDPEIWRRKLQEFAEFRQLDTSVLS